MLDWVILSAIGGTAVAGFTLSKFVVMPLVGRTVRITKMEDKLDAHIDSDEIANATQNTTIKDVSDKLDKVHTKVDKLDGKMDVMLAVLNKVERNGNYEGR